MPKYIPHSLDDLAHELNAIRVLLNIWDEQVPCVVTRSIHKRIHNMERTIRRLRKSGGKIPAQSIRRRKLQ